MGSFREEHGKRCASYESDKENAKDIAHRIPKYFRM
jgi:hypothetical protein